MEELPRISNALRILQLNRNALSDIDAGLLCELGSILMSILRGVPAGELFRQNERTKPERDWWNLAVVYYFVRACSDDVTDDSDAIAQVKAAEGSGTLNSAEAIRKSIRNYRKSALDLLEQDCSAATLLVFLTTRTARYRHLQQLHLVAPSVAATLQQYPALNNLVNEQLRDFKFTADEVAELERQRVEWDQRYKLTPEKASRLREYLRRKSPRMRD